MKKDFFLFLPTGVAMLLDFTVTIAGQPREYWNTSFLYANEGSPALSLLHMHPLLFFLVNILWMLFIFFLVTKIPKPYKQILCYGFLFGHFWGSSTWLSTILYKYIENPFHVSINNWIAHVLYGICFALLLTYSLTKQRT